MPPGDPFTLDDLYSRDHFEALALEPGRVGEQVRAHASAELTRDDFEARDALFHAALTQINALAARAMRLRLDQALATDTSIGTPTRKVFASTIVNYAADLGLLEQRAREQAVRGGAEHPAEVAAVVATAAKWVIDLRAALRNSVFAVVAQLSAQLAPAADRNARDRSLVKAERMWWSALRRDLEALAAQPSALSAGALGERIATLPEQIDDADPGRETTFADMIEID